MPNRYGLLADGAHTLENGRPPSFRGCSRDVPWKPIMDEECPGPVPVPSPELPNAGHAAWPIIAAVCPELIYLCVSGGVSITAVT